jgi:hypothetical protein
MAEHINGLNIWFLIENLSTGQKKIGFINDNKKHNENRNKSAAMRKTSALDTAQKDELRILPYRSGNVRGGNISFSAQMDVRNSQA